ncbi:MAG: hypothetical protein U0838_15530 [Chloroflexota bacterium]
MTKPTRARAAGWLAAGALLTALIAPATVAASGPTVDPNHNAGPSCTQSLFTWSVSNGANAYPMLTVTVQAKDGVPQGCTFSFSLNSYKTDGPTWPSSGTQALVDHQSVTLSADKTSATLTVAKPECYGQTDFYTGTTAFDGKDGALPHYPGTVTPTGLIAYSNGGKACEQPSSSPSQPVESESIPPSNPPSESPSSSPSESPSESPSQPVESESIPPSESPSASPSESPSSSPSESPSASPSESPSASPSSSPSNKPSSSPSGSVEAETGTPQITPPPTDSTTPSSNGTGSGGS